MKTLNKAAALLLMATSSLAHADGLGTRGGGQVVDVNKNPVLRDFVDKTDCDWYRGNEIADQLSYLPKVISAVRQAHWYFADVLQKEPSQLWFCETQADLKPISTEDVDGVGVATTEGAEPVAIRINNTVYLSMPVFGKLNAVNQAYVMVHESMHSFIKWGESQRNTKLRSFVESIRTLETTGMTPDHFQTQMEQDSITIPAQMAILSHEADFKTMEDSTLSSDQRLDAMVRIYGKDAAFKPETVKLYQGDQVDPLISSIFGETSYGVTAFGNDASLILKNFLSNVNQRIDTAIASGDISTLKNIYVDRQYNFPNATVAERNCDSRYSGCTDAPQGVHLPLFPGLAGNSNNTPITVTALGYAVLMRQPAVASFLLQIGLFFDMDYYADDSATKGFGITALELAQRLHYDEMIAVLKK